MSERPTVDDIRDAQERLGVAASARVPSETLSRLSGRSVLLRAEPPAHGRVQDPRAYNDRPAVGGRARTGRADGERRKYGQAVAWAARQGGSRRGDLRSRGRSDGEGRRRGYGARSSSRARDSTRRSRSHKAARRRRDRRSSAFDDVRVVAGQGTLGLELAGQLPSGNVTVVIPVGGGGSRQEPRSHSMPCVPRSGSSASSRPRARRSPATRPRGATIADGIAVKVPGAITRPIADDLLDDVVVVDDDGSPRRRSSCCSSGRSSSWRARSGARGGDPGESRRRQGPVVRRPRGRQRRRDDDELVIRYGLTASGRYLVVALLIPTGQGSPTSWR